MPVVVRLSSLQKHCAPTNVHAAQVLESVILYKQYFHQCSMSSEVGGISKQNRLNSLPDLLESVHNAGREMGDYVGSISMVIWCHIWCFYLF